MTWVLPLLTAWLLLTLPGYALIRILGVRVPLRWGWSPAVTVTLTVALTGAMRLAGIPWNPVPVLFMVTVVIVSLAGVRILLARRRTRIRPAAHGGNDDSSPARPAPGRRAEWLVSGVTAVAGLALVASASRWMGGIDSLNGSYDAFFHHASIAFIRDGGDAFLTTALTEIYGEPTFYPVAWAALASLSPFEVVGSANAMMLAVLAAGPAALAAMLLVLLPQDRAVGVAVGVSAIASTLFLSPAVVAMVMGLWPFALGVLCLPLALGALGRLSTPGLRFVPLRELVFLGIVVVGAVLAHPSNAFSMAVFAGLLILVTGIRRLARDENPRRGRLEMMIALLGAGVFVIVSATLLSGMHLTAPVDEPLLTTLISVLTDSTRLSFVDGSPPLVLGMWLLAALGAVTAVRRLEVIGTAATIGVVLTVVLSLLTQYSNPVAVALVNPWYGARERIAPLMMCLVLVLMSRGLMTLAQLSRQRSRMRWTVPAAASVVLVSVVLGLVMPQRLPTIGTRSYIGHGMNAPQYVTEEERELILQTAAVLPENAVVIADPRDGAPVFWFEGGVKTVFPTLAQPQTRDSQLLGAYLTNPDDRRHVCGAFERVAPTHLYRDSSDHSGSSLYPEASGPWRGIHDVPASELELVAEDGPYALYELETPC